MVQGLQASGWARRGGGGRALRRRRFGAWLGKIGSGARSAAAGTLIWCWPGSSR